MTSIVRHNINNMLGMYVAEVTICYVVLLREYYAVIVLQVAS